MLPIPALSFSMRKILFIIFAFSVIVSHYSTNFVLLALIAFVYISTMIIVYVEDHNFPAFCEKTFASLLFNDSFHSQKIHYPTKRFLNLPLILILFLTTYALEYSYIQIHQTNAASVIAEVVSSIFVTSNVDKSSDLSYSIFFAPKHDPQQELQDYINQHSSIREV